MCFFVLLSGLWGLWCIVPWSTIILQSTPKGYIQLEITIHTFISLNFQVKVHLPHTSEQKWYVYLSFGSWIDVKRIKEVDDGKKKC